MELDALIALKGFEISGYTCDDHSHDGQMCEYDFTFTSPSGATTSISTDMCLAVGFNWDGNLSVKIEESSKETNERLEEAQRKDHEKNQKKKAKRKKSDDKWFELIENNVDRSIEEFFDVLKEYKFPTKYKQ